MFMANVKFVYITTNSPDEAREIGRALVQASFFFQAEVGIRVAQESRGLGDVYKRQGGRLNLSGHLDFRPPGRTIRHDDTCLLYTSDAADDLTRVDLGGRRIIKKK